LYYFPSNLDVIAQIAMCRFPSLDDWEEAQIQRSQTLSLQTEVIRAVTCFIGGLLILPYDE
jgi:hypothetical protein